MTKCIINYAVTDYRINKKSSKQKNDMPIPNRIYMAFLILLAATSLPICQPSFQVQLEIDSTSARAVMTNTNGNVAAVFIRPLAFDKRNIIAKISSNTGQAQGFKYIDGLQIYPFIGQSMLIDNRAYISQYVPVFHSCLLSMDVNTGGYWCKKMRRNLGHSYASFSMDNNGNMLVLNAARTQPPITHLYPELGQLEIYKLDANGDAIWKKGYVLFDSAQGDTLVVANRGIEIGQNNILYIFGEAHDVSSPENNTFIASLDEMGNFITWKTIKNTFPSNMVVTNEGLYLLTKFHDSFTTNSWSGEKVALITKLDHDLNILWSKKYYAENFSFQQATLTKSESGRLFFSCSTYGAYPAILADLDVDGNIVSQKGYPNYTPNLDLDEGGSLVMASSYGFDNLGNLTKYPIIAKTDESGEITGCPSFPTCLIAGDTIIQMGSFYFEPHSVLDLEDVVLDIEPVAIPLSDFCGYPPTPIPDFSFPDSICVGESATTTSIGNRLAQARVWHLTGPGIDSTLEDSLEFSFDFLLPGEYNLLQSVWVLGCRKDHAQKIVVLPPLTVEIMADSLICPDEPPIAMAEANRNASFIWSNGDSGEVGNLNSGGLITVQATDGYCMAADSTHVALAAEKLGSAAPFSIPLDTTVCAINQYFELKPKSQFAQTFFTRSNPNPTNSLLFEQAGSYEIGMEAFGCVFWLPFHLEVGCDVSLYLPNVFSPNHDGINDIFEAFGNDFSVLELRVYDRWGGLQYVGTAWDGGDAAQGVYTYTLVYQNLITGQMAELNGEVTLLR
jgi:hypothetical protein